MIIRDLYRCPAEDLLKAMVASGQPVMRRGIIEPASALGPPDLAYITAHPDFDPSLSLVAYDGAEPVAYLVSRIVGPAENAEAIWSFFGGRPQSERAREMLLDAAMDQWRKEKAKRARKGLTGLLGNEPRMAEDTPLIDLLKNRGIEVKTLGAEMAAEMKKLPTPLESAVERENQLRQKGYIVRPATADETAVVARQYHPRHTGWLSLEFWNCFARHLRAEAMAVLELRRQIIGYAAYLGWTIEGDCPELGPLYVEQAYRSSHLEDILLRHILAATKQAGKPRVKLNCGTDRVQFYQRAGFAVAAYYCREAGGDLH